MVLKRIVDRREWGRHGRRRSTEGGGGGRRLMTLAIIALMLTLSVLGRAGSGARADGLPPGTVHVHFHGCPTQSSGGLNWGYDVLMATCKEPAWYVTFSLTSEGQQ